MNQKKARKPAGRMSARTSAAPSLRRSVLRALSTIQRKPAPRKSVAARITNAPKKSRKPVGDHRSRNTQRKRSKISLLLTAEGERVSEVLRQLAKAQAELNARGADLLSLAHDLGREAVDSFKTELLRSLVEDELLTGLHRLQTSAIPDDLKLVPEAALNWLARHLDLVQHLQPGQRIEIPALQLNQFVLEGPLPDPSKQLVEIQVIVPGWKCRGQPIVPPRVAFMPAFALQHHCALAGDRS